MDVKMDETGKISNVPSGNLLHSYWKWWFIVEFPIKMVIVHSVLLTFTRPGNLTHISCEDGITEARKTPILPILRQQRLLGRWLQVHDQLPESPRGDSAVEAQSRVLEEMPIMEDVLAVESADVESQHGEGKLGNCVRNCWAAAWAISRSSWT